MKAAAAPYRVDRYLVAQAAGARGWITALGAAVAIAIAYFLPARLGLALISASSDLAAFWPSGVAAGILIVLGRRVLPAVVIGVVVGTVAANLMSNRSLVTCPLNGSWNVGVAVPAAWLLERRFGRPFSFVDRRVAAFSLLPVLQPQPPPFRALRCTSYTSIVLVCATRSNASRSSKERGRGASMSRRKPIPTSQV